MSFLRNQLPLRFNTGVIYNLIVSESIRYLLIARNYELLSKDFIDSLIEYITEYVHIDNLNEYQLLFDIIDHFIDSIIDYFIPVYHYDLYVTDVNVEIKQDIIFILVEFSN